MPLAPRRRRAIRSRPPRSRCRARWSTRTPTWTPAAQTSDRRGGGDGAGGGGRGASRRSPSGTTWPRRAGRSPPPTWHPDLYAAVGCTPPGPTRSPTRHEQRDRRDWPASPGWSAIGETGLDHYWDAAPHEVQAEAFAWHIDLAKRAGKALMIHDREAHSDDRRHPAHRGSLRTPSCSTASPGTRDFARECLDLGAVLSFAGPVTFRNAPALRDAAALVPLDRLLVETDAPFLTPIHIAADVTSHSPCRTPFESWPRSRRLMSKRCANP